MSCYEHEVGVSKKVQKLLKEFSVEQDEVQRSKIMTELYYLDLGLSEAPEGVQTKQFTRDVQLSL